MTNEKKNPAAISLFPAMNSLRPTIRLVGSATTEDTYQIRLIRRIYSESSGSAPMLRMKAMPLLNRLFIC
ncbi:MAG TPA: hypothetical protein DIW61_11945 [Candidatus Aminicenantes bacterium]|nr:hypothetical protein [Candidatus Aminicenantes bacterium]